MVSRFCWGVLTVAAGALAQQSVLEDRFFNSDGVEIRYVDQGRGAAVVLVHGYTGNLERHWVAPGILSNLGKDHRVIALDCRGHGKSGKPTDPRLYGAEMGRDVIRLLDHLKIARAHLVGYSMGAVIAGQLLTSDGDRFFSATFIGHHPVRKWTAEHEKEAEAAALELESETPFRSLILGISPADARPSEEEIRRLAQGLVATNDLKALAALHRGRRGLVASEAALAAVRVPTLEIIGSADRNLPDAQELTKVMPNLKLVTVEGATHGGDRGVLRRPEALRALRDFIAQRRGMFVFQDNFWLNLHQCLRREVYRRSLKAAPGLDTGLLPEADLGVWNRALDSYADLARRDVLFDELSRRIGNTLAMAGDVLALPESLDGTIGSSETDAASKPRTKP